MDDIDEMGDMGDRDDMAERAPQPHISRGGTSRRRAGDDLRDRILHAIEDYGREHRRPPTIREIATAVGIESSGHVAHHVTMLERQGLLSRESGKSRGLQSRRRAQGDGLRVLGVIAAGEPLDLFDAEEFELLEPGEVALTSVPTGGEEIYALRVRGASMIEDGILDGDYVLVAPEPTVTNGAIAVAIQNTPNGGRGAATLKRIFFLPDGVRLQPANAALAARFIPADEWKAEWRVQGRVVAVYRRCAWR